MVGHMSGEYEIHEAMDVSPERATGVFSAKFSPGGNEILCGTSHSLLLYDVERKLQVESIVDAHADDINSVGYADRTYRPHLFLTASDDTLVKVWDRRSMGRTGRPAGVLPGHAEGLTHIVGKGDGRYVLTNGKDQCAKLWDLRKMYSASEFRALPRVEPRFSWDYRWAHYPVRTAWGECGCGEVVVVVRLWPWIVAVGCQANGKGHDGCVCVCVCVFFCVCVVCIVCACVCVLRVCVDVVPHQAWGRPYKHPHDCSVMTYRGHVVLNTLIRCYFSPQPNTGQRYIYSGSHVRHLKRLCVCACGPCVVVVADAVDPADGWMGVFHRTAQDGIIYVYDALTGELVHQLVKFHTRAGAPIRDVSWHPSLPIITAAAFDGQVTLWQHVGFQCSKSLGEEDDGLDSGSDVAG